MLRAATRLLQVPQWPPITPRRAQPRDYLDQLLDQNQGQQPVSTWRSCGINKTYLYKKVHVTC